MTVEHALSYNPGRLVNIRYDNGVSMKSFCLGFSGGCVSHKAYYSNGASSQENQPPRMQRRRQPPTLRTAATASTATAINRADEGNLRRARTQEHNIRFPPENFYSCMILLLVGVILLTEILLVEHNQHCC